MNALAKLCVKRGYSVTGSDKNYSDRLLELSLMGVKVWVGSEPENMAAPDLVVYSGAIRPDDKELLFAVSNGITCMERSAFLGATASLFKTVIAVAGTHGKTTVTSLIAKILIDSGKKCCCHIGGDAVGIGNLYYSGDDYFLTEACEYRKSLLYLRPSIAVVLNARFDHPDTYRDLSEVYDVFDDFLLSVGKNGLAVSNGDSDYYKLRRAFSDDITFGLEERDRFRAENVKEYKKGFFGFVICDYGNPLFEVKLPLPGLHNVDNALCAAAVGILLRIPYDSIKRSIESFEGVERRFLKTSVYFGATVYVDYAHHPDEIKASIATAKSMLKDNKRLFCVFQPHTYSRTATLLDDFVSCLKADDIIIMKEYPAREVPADGKSAKELFCALTNPRKEYFDNIIDIAAYLTEKIRPDDIVLILGAGDIDVLSYLLGREKQDQSSKTTDT